MEFGVYIGRVLTIIYRARILVAMNSIYSTLMPLSIAGTCSSGLVLRRLLFRSMTITNVVLLPISILRVETIIPSMAIATTAVIVTSRIGSIVGISMNLIDARMLLDYQN